MKTTTYLSALAVGLLGGLAQADQLTPNAPASETRIAALDAAGTIAEKTTPAPLKFISAADPCILLTGFVTKPNPDTALLKFSGSGLRCRFRSDRGLLRFGAATAGRLWIKLDDREFAEYPVKPKIDLTGKLLRRPDRIHQLQVVKKTEFPAGIEAFEGIELDANAVLLPSGPLPQRKILFCGDSITVGMAAGRDRSTDFLRSYTWLLGRHFNADIRVIAVSGIGVFKGWRTERFIKLLREVDLSPPNLQKPQPPDFSWQPDLVLVNLGTNDVSRSVAAEDFLPAMKELLLEVRKRCPQAKIALMVPWCGCYREGLRSLVADLAQGGFSSLHFIDGDPDTWLLEDGMSDNTHPWPGSGLGFDCFSCASVARMCIRRLDVRFTGFGHRDLCLTHRY